MTDEGQIIASPLETVLTHELMQFLEEYFAREEVEMMVVGRPRKWDNSDSESMKQIQFFVQAFRKRFTRIPVRKGPNAASV